MERILTFIAVVEGNGFTAAARKCNVSTAAISRQISMLESELQTELLLRTTRQVTLTEIGAQYYQQCKKILGELKDAELAITSSQQEAIGTLNITSSRYFAMNYLIPHLYEFINLNPKLQIRFELAERFPNLAKEEIDILFGVSMESDDKGLVRRRVATTRYILCGSPLYFKKNGMPKIPSDLTKHRYITHAMRKPDNVLVFTTGQEIHVNPILWLNDCYAMRECAIQHMGIIKMHDYIVKDALKNQQLIEVLHEYQEPQQPVYLYYQQSRYLQPKIRRFIDFYLSKMENG